MAAIHGRAWRCGGHPASPNPLQADTAATPKTLDHPHRSPSLPLISRFGTRTRGKPPLTINAATVIAFAGKNIQVNRRHLLRPSRAPNRAEPPRTLAIAPLFTTYFTGRRHRLRHLRSTSNLPVASVGTMVSTSTDSPRSWFRSVPIPP